MFMETNGGDIPSVAISDTQSLIHLLCKPPN